MKYILGAFSVFMGILNFGTLSSASIKKGLLTVNDPQTGNKVKVGGYYDFEKSLFIPYYSENAPLDLSTFDRYSIIIDDGRIIEAGLNEVVRGSN